MNIILPHVLSMPFVLPCPRPLQDRASMNVALNLSTHIRMETEDWEMVDDSEVFE